MARRRRRKKEVDLLEGLLGLGLLGIALLTWQATKSLAATGVACGLFLGLVIAIMVMRSIAYTERLKKSGIAEIDKMEGRQFEHYLGHLFRTHGYAVGVTQASGDFGADLILEKAGRKIVIQAKRYSNNVGIKAVQEAHSSIPHYKANEAWVVTNAGFTDAAMELAKSANVRLVGREQLIEMILQMKQGSKPQPTPTQVIEHQTVQEQKTCPKCGAAMIRRKSSMGYFLGCENFPKCRSTQVI